jgi:endogenous inhibitor of DNA gyrase (YacG/DUF329 family)
LAHAVDEDDLYDDDSGGDGGDNDGLLDEDPDESEQDVDDDGETVPCPFCKKPIHEDADICPRCGNYVGGTDAPRHVPMFVWVGLVLAGLCVLTWVLFG